MMKLVELLPLAQWILPCCERKLKETTNIINVEVGDNELITIGKAQKYVAEEGTYAR